MTARPTEATLISTGSGLQQAVGIGAVTGGREDQPIARAYVTNAGLTTAIRQSLATHAMAAPDGTGRYRLDVAISELRLPVAGFAIEVTARVRYRMVDTATGAVPFDREIASAHTEPFNAFMPGDERARLAVEGALRGNLQLFLATLVAEETRNPAIFGGTQPLPAPLLRQAAPPPIRASSPRGRPPSSQQLY